MAVSGRTLGKWPRRDALQWGIVSAPVVFFAVVAWVHRNIIEDGYIYLRIVHQVTGGRGPVFNAGERVEVFTGPLWLAILSAGDLLTPLRLEWLAVLTGIGSTIGGIVLAMAGSARLLRLYASDALLVPFGVLVLVSATAMWFYASSGLETGITFLWLAGCLWLLATWATATTRLPRRAAVVLGLGWLVRPELLLYSIAFLAVVLALQWRTDTWRHRTRLVVAAVAAPLAYQIFRMGYYGALVANTAIAKEGTRVRWERGWRYFVDFAGTYWIVVPLVVMLVGGWLPALFALARGGQRRAVWVVVAFVATGTANATYVIAVGGDYEHARLLLPSLFAVCAPIAVVPAIRRHLAATAMAPWAVAAIAVMRPPDLALGSTFAVPPKNGTVTTDEAGWGPGGARLRRVAGADLVVSTNITTVEPSDLPLAPTVHRPTAALTAVGRMPYAAGTNLHVFDLLGLADPFTARLETPVLTTLLPYAGHEKPLPPPWIAARLVPEGIPVRPSQLPTTGHSLIPAVSGPAFDEQVRYARATWECPAIRRLRATYTDKLTPGRFLRNLIGSFSNTRLRIPPDPQLAYRKFCGTAALAEVGRGRAPVIPVRVVPAPHARRNVQNDEPVERSGRVPSSGPTESQPGYIVPLAGFV